jgi:hypothetical protein
MYCLNGKRSENKISLLFSSISFDEKSASFNYSIKVNLFAFPVFDLCGIKAMLD